MANNPVGIKAVGSYIPIQRIDRQVIMQAWEFPKDLAVMMVGERSMAHADEDVLTMSSEAVLNCLEGQEASSVDGLYFASTSSPYWEKATSSTLAVVADLRADIAVADFANSVRSSHMALKAAVDAVKAGSARNIVVAASDIRLNEPEYYMEAMMGDGAGALLVGQGGNIICEILDYCTVNQEFFDVWRKKEDSYLNYDDERFANLYGYLNVTKQAVQGLLKKSGLKPEDVSKTVAFAPHGAAYMALAKGSGPLAMSFNQDPLLMSVGNLGNASTFLQLALVLEDSSPGDRILLVGYGDGADVFLLRVTDGIKNLPKKRSIRDWLNSKKMFSSYAKYLKYREMLKLKEGIWPKDPFTSIAYLYREQKQDLGLHGKKCNKCGTVWFPAGRVCYACQTKDDYSDVKLSRRGKIVTFTVERAIPAPETPVGMTVVDLDGGGRFLTQFTEGNVDELKIGLDIELGLRKYHEAKGFNHYFWKSRPVR